MKIEEKMGSTLIGDFKIKPIMEELIALKPIFHHSELGTIRKGMRGFGKYGVFCES